jgi:transcriptional regulator with XRE-family HTH domain
MTTQTAGDIPLDTWATRLLIARTQRGLNQEQAADLCGINRSRWGTWERDGRIPRNQVEVAQKISEGLGYDLNWLMLGGPLANGRGGPDGGGLPRLDSNQRPSDYTSDGDPIDLMDHIERRRNLRSIRPRIPFRRKEIHVSPWAA